MKNKILPFLILLCSLQLSAQVGIGTLTPSTSSILELSSTTKGFLFPRMTYTQRTAISGPATGLMVYQTNAVGTSQSGIYFYDGSLWKRIARSDEITGGGPGGWTIVGDDQYSNLAGNVGIGSTTPTSKLHLVGNFLQDNGSVTLNNPAGIIQFQNAGVNKGFIQISGNNFRFGTNSTNSGGSVIVRMNGNDRMALDSVGSMGLGTITPNASAKLDIVSTTRGVLLPRLTNSQMFAIDNPADGLLIYNTDYDLLAHYSGGWKNILNSTFWSRPITARDRIANAQDSVGIGNSGPLARLHVTNGSFANYSTHNGHIMLGTAGGLNLAIGHYEILARDNGAAAPLYLQQEGGLVRMGNGGVATGAKLQITDGEEAGLGTHGYMIVGETASESIVIDNNDIQSKDDGTATYLKLQQSGGPGVQIGTTAETPQPVTKLYIPFGEDAGLSTDGYVHVGFKANDNIVIDNNEILARSGGGTATLFLQNSGGGMKVGSDNKLFVGSNGNVGIGTGTPLAKLDVNGRIRVEQSNEAVALDGTNPYYSLWYNGSYRSRIQQLTDQLYIVSNDKVHLDGDQVAIGNMLSTANDYKLTVTGKVICEELKVELAANWPDYVFADEYELKPLHELKSFIETNQHLPNIPKASEVERDGFEVGEMNRKLLEKVEELTLYIISLQEQIDALKKGIEK